VCAGISDQLFFRRTQQVEQGELAIPGEEFVVPLDVEEDRGSELHRVAPDTARHFRPVIRTGRLPKPEFAKDRATELAAKCSRSRQAKACTHGHAQVPDPGRVHVPGFFNGVHGCPPIASHPVDDDVDTFSHDASLVASGIRY
jgi:hypothetical protein